MIAEWFVSGTQDPNSDCCLTAAQLKWVLSWEPVSILSRSFHMDQHQSAFQWHWIFELNYEWGKSWIFASSGTNYFFCGLGCHVPPACRAATGEWRDVLCSWDKGLALTAVLSPGDRTLCPLRGERCWRRHWLHSHGPSLPREVFYLHNVQQQAEGTTFLCRGEESLLWTLLHCEYPFLFVPWF